ncbi:MAG: hypothetical protein CTY33_06955 [Methylotenera sp.]|nr:MAG: hypothetical protein CTY33_06955 [Methylotenera sp.]
MRKSLLLTAVLGALYMPSVSFAEEEAAPAAAAAPVEPWTVTTNIGFVSDYYARGVSQTWHKPAVQGGFDVAHSSGFSAGIWGSNVSPNTYPDANVEIDIYGGYAGTIPAVEGLGYSVGLIGYLYPGGSWKKYTSSTSIIGNAKQTPSGGSWDTYEANIGISYKWLSAKASMTIGDWYGAEKDTGWNGGTSGTTYLELNAAYPLPVWGLTLVGHVGHLNVAGKLDPTFTNGLGDLPSTSLSGETNPDYTDWKVGLSKSFSIAKSEGWNAGVYYVGNDNDRYWGDRGYGGTSFNGKGTPTKAQSKDLNDDRIVITVGRVF